MRSNAGAPHLDRAGPPGRHLPDPFRTGPRFFSTAAMARGVTSGQTMPIASSGPFTDGSSGSCRGCWRS